MDLKLQICERVGRVVNHLSHRNQGMSEGLEVGNLSDNSFTNIYLMMRPNSVNLS